MKKMVLSHPSDRSPKATFNCWDCTNIIAAFGGLSRRWCWGEDSPPLQLWRARQRRSGAEPTFVKWCCPILQTGRRRRPLIVGTAPAILPPSAAYEEDGAGERIRTSVGHSPSDLQSATYHPACFANRFLFSPVPLSGPSRQIARVSKMLAVRSA